MKLENKTNKDITIHPPFSESITVKPGDFYIIEKYSFLINGFDAYDSFYKILTDTFNGKINEVNNCKCSRLDVINYGCKCGGK